MHVHVETTGTGPTVLLIHGTAPAIWGELPRLLAEGGHRAVWYDRRSFGDSPGAAPRSLSDHAADAAAVLSEHGAPATVVGWSIGGVIALELAAERPELVDGLVLLEPPLHAKRHPRPAMLAAIAGATLRGKLGRDAAGARRFLRWALGRRDGGTDLDTMPAPWHARLQAGDGRAVVRELALGTGEHLSARRLGAIRAPTRVFAGERSDPIFTAAAQRIAATLPNATVTTVPAGHAIQLAVPDLVAGAVAAVRGDSTRRMDAGAFAADG